VNDWENLGLLSSPTIEGNRVYLVTSRCEVMCLTTDGLAKGNVGPFTDEGQYIVGPGKPKVVPSPTDADIVWRYDMMDELGVFPHNASNCSILIVGDMIYVVTSNGQDWTHVNVPAPNAPSFVVLNKKTGELMGEDRERVGERLFHGQWSSPSTGKVGDKQLVFFGGGDGVLYAFDAVPVKEADGAFLKKVWWVDCNPPEYKVKDGKPIKYPAPEGPSEINATPVFYKNRVYVPTGQDPEHGEGVGRLVVIDATKTGDLTKAGVIWEYRGIHRSISTVSIDPETGLLFVADFSGFVHCLDAETGKLNWVHDLKAHVWGSTLVADGKVYIGDEDGDLCILAASKEKKVLSEVNFGAPIYSTPIVANGIMYIGSQTHLFAIAEGAKPVNTDAPATLNLQPKP
jgi:outer membrane protein assembly factor BamB